jgi:hypothetical protein
MTAVMFQSFTSPKSGYDLQRFIKSLRTHNRIARLTEPFKDLSTITKSYTDD